MKKKVEFALEADDDASVILLVETLLTYVQRLAPPEHGLDLTGTGRLPSVDLPDGVRAVRRMKGRSFTAREGAAFVAYVNEMAAVGEARANAVEEEARQGLAGRPEDDLSVRAYADLASTLRSDAKWARRSASDLALCLDEGYASAA